MYRCKDARLLLFANFFLPVGGKFSEDNRWVKLADLIPWDVLEHHHISQFCQGIEALVKPFHTAPGAVINQERVQVPPCTGRGPAQPSVLPADNAVV
jgi:hypothetical protein